MFNKAVGKRITGGSAFVLTLFASLLPCKLFPSPDCQRGVCPSYHQKLTSNATSAMQLQEEMGEANVA